MSEEPVFERIGALLLERLREEMAPAVLNQEDDIKLTHPGAETDYRFGVFLHDIEEVRPYGPPTSVRVSEDTRRHPDRLFALHFLLYANRKVPFDSMTALDEILNGRLICEIGVAPVRPAEFVIFRITQITQSAA